MQASFDDGWISVSMRFSAKQAIKLARAVIVIVVVAVAVVYDT